jgi:hypothetical protein
LSFAIARYIAASFFARMAYSLGRSGSSFLSSCCAEGSLVWFVSTIAPRP